MHGTRCRYGSRRKRRVVAAGFLTLACLGAGGGSSSEAGPYTAQQPLSRAEIRYRRIADTVTALARQLSSVTAGERAFDARHVDAFHTFAHQLCHAMELAERALRRARFEEATGNPNGAGQSGARPRTLDSTRCRETGPASFAAWGVPTPNGSWHALFVTGPPDGELALSPGRWGSQQPIEVIVAGAREPRTPSSSYRQREPALDGVAIRIDAPGAAGQGGLRLLTIQNEPDAAAPFVATPSSAFAAVATELRRRFDAASLSPWPERSMLVFEDAPMKRGQ